MMKLSEDRSEIVFFDVETTVPTRTGQGYALLEFGAILVCPRKLVEMESYSTLIRPEDLSRINSMSVRCNGISRENVASAPRFREVADRVYDILHGRIWAGHNILRFDCVRIKEAFDEIGRVAPEPKGTIDSLVILTQKFGRRAGNMKMASIAAYFGLGEQTHRSLDDVRMNFEVVKHCATVLFLESSLPDIFPENSWVSPNANTRSHIKGKAVLNQAESSDDRHNAFDMGSLRSEMKTDNLQPDVNMDEDVSTRPYEKLPQSSGMEGCTEDAGFLDPDQVSISSICVAPAPFYRACQRLRISHKDTVLQLYCSGLRVRFGISTKYSDHAGRPRLNFVVDASPSLCRVLDACDGAALKVSMDAGSDSQWKPVVVKKNGYFNSPNVRLHLPTAVNGEGAMIVTEIYRQDSSGITHKLTFETSSGGEPELGILLVPGTAIDAYISLEHYDYKQNAGIKLVLKKLIIHSA